MPYNYGYSMLRVKLDRTSYIQLSPWAQCWVTLNVRFNFADTCGVIITPNKYSNTYTRITPCFQILKQLFSLIWRFILLKVSTILSNCLNKNIYSKCQRWSVHPQNITTTLYGNIWCNSDVFQQVVVTSDIHYNING